MEARYDFTKEQVSLYYLLLYEDNSKIRLRCLAMYLKSFQLTHSLICSICKISKPSLIKYLREFKEYGRDSLKIQKRKVRTSILHNYKELILVDFSQTQPRTIEEAGNRIEKITQIKRSVTQIRLFLKEIKYEIKKNKSASY